jgi:DNA-binding Xre family transcriptional regulator
VPTIRKPVITPEALRRWDNTLTEYAITKKLMTVMNLLASGEADETALELLELVCAELRVKIRLGKRSA